MFPVCCHFEHPLSLLETVARGTVTKSRWLETNRPVGRKHRAGGCTTARYAHLARGRVTPEPSKGGAGTGGLEGTDTETGDGGVWASAGCSNRSDEQW